MVLPVEKSVDQKTVFLKDFTSLLLFVNLPSSSNFKRKKLSVSVKAVCLEVNSLGILWLKYFHASYSVAAVVQDHFSINRLKNYSDTSEFFFNDANVALTFLTRFFFPPQLSISN